MTDDDRKPDESSFIPRSLRPNLSYSDNCPPPPEAATSLSGIRLLAEKAMGPALLDRFGLSGPPARPDQICMRSPDVIWTAVGGEAVLLDLSSGYYYTLNRTGAAIWELLTGERDLAGVREAICERFGVSSETAWEDLASLVGHLRREKLITFKDEPNG
jgi:hypothetical protein